MPLTKYNNNSISSLTALPAAIPTGKLKLISSQTASNSASISFTTGLTSTYKVYKFVFMNIHARTDAVIFQFNLSTDSGSNYNVTKTTTAFGSYHAENDTGTGLAYDAVQDLAQSTAYQPLNVNTSLGNVSDENISGSLTLFNPSSTTYVKHFISCISNNAFNDYGTNDFVAGYGNTTSAINAIRFQMSSGNFDGTIYLYAIDNS
jgi:hypothetical protein